LVYSNLMLKTPQTRKKFACGWRCFEDSALTQKLLENYDRAIVSSQKCLDKTNNPGYLSWIRQRLFCFKIMLTQNSFKHWLVKNVGIGMVYTMFFYGRTKTTIMLLELKLIEFNKDFQDDLVSLYMYTNQKIKLLSLLVTLIWTNYKFCVSNRNFTNCNWKSPKLTSLKKKKWFKKRKILR
jgi:hypothetical protein